MFYIEGGGDGQIFSLAQTSEGWMEGRKEGRKDGWKEGHTEVHIEVVPT